MEDPAEFDALSRLHPFAVEQTVYLGSKTLLHIATEEAKGGIVGLLVMRCPQLARAVDENRSTPLHIAAATGDVAIAQGLFNTAPEMCWRLDDYGMNPVHVAAANGHVDILRLLLQRDPSPGMELLEGRRSVLSLCVKRRHLAALAFLVETFPDLLHTKDADGETIMSFAMKYKHPEIIAHLRRHGAFTPITTMIQNASGMSPVVLVLIAQMAHAASLSPPGGFWQDTTNSHEAGNAVLASTRPILYKLLNHSNNIAIASCLLVILLFTIGAPKTSTIYSAVVLLGTIAALGAISLGYGTTVIISSPVEIQPGLVIAIVGSAVVLFFFCSYSH